VLNCTGHMRYSAAIAWELLFSGGVGGTLLCVQPLRPGPRHSAAPPLAVPVPYCVQHCTIEEDVKKADIRGEGVAGSRRCKAAVSLAGVVGHLLQAGPAAQRETTHTTDRGADEKEKTNPHVTLLGQTLHTASGQHPVVQHTAGMSPGPLPPYVHSHALQLGFQRQPRLHRCTLAARA
jgi:hypothetical protein